MIYWDTGQRWDSFRPKASPALIHWIQIQYSTTVWTQPPGQTTLNALFWKYSRDHADKIHDTTIPLTKRPVCLWLFSLIYWSCCPYQRNIFRLFLCICCSNWEFLNWCFPRITPSFLPLTSKLIVLTDWYTSRNVILLGGEPSSDLTKQRRTVAIVRALSQCRAPLFSARV